jgi:hypothetical protein
MFVDKARSLPLSGEPESCFTLLGLSCCSFGSLLNF